MKKAVFDNVKKNFGFGCMRLPMKNGEVDYDEFSRMIDLFFEGGFNYFDTAHGYLGGKSEIAIRECLVKRYPRDKYTLTDKLTGNFFSCEADIRPASTISTSILCTRKARKSFKNSKNAEPTKLRSN